MSVTSQNHRLRRSLSTLRDELNLFQEESQFFQRLLRRSQRAAQQQQLQDQLQQFQHETLPNLQRTLRTIEGQNANTTQAENGQSHFSLFMESLENARQQMNKLKRQALRELNNRSMPLSIW
ncbi:MAG TPA: hypothetical protein VJ933_09560 [Phaeodactylibacter sp.]|nr:hypothetical protein [Phaeodactylibacter sp.]